MKEGVAREEGRRLKKANSSTLRYDIVCSAYVADVLFRQVGEHHVFLEDVGDCTCLFRRGFLICCF